MDGIRFDLIAKAVAARPSRRGALAVLAGATLATLAPSRRQVAAGCVGSGNPCNGTGDCCPGLLCYTGGCCADSICDADHRCCDERALCCAGQCVLDFTNQNCGACGNACTPPYYCYRDRLNWYNGSAICCPPTKANEGGVCVCFTATDTDCGQECADLRTSDQHCGTCGNACAEGERCSYDGERGEARCCPVGTVFCAGGCLPCDGHGLACVGGACRCGPGFKDCGGRCTDVVFNDRHCGRCGRTCGDRQYCSFRHCCPRHHDWCRRRGRCESSWCDFDWGDYWDPDRCKCMPSW